MPHLRPLLLCLGLLLAAAGCDFGDDGPSARVGIIDITAGAGPEAAEDDTVRIAYEGRLQLTNELFDEATAEDPFDFVLGAGQVIEGFERGVPGMRVGGTRRLTIPPELAYGRRGAGCTEEGCIIPPNATLIFRVTLLAINPPDPQLP